MVSGEDHAIFNEEEELDYEEDDEEEYDILTNNPSSTTANPSQMVDDEEDDVDVVDVDVEVEHNNDRDDSTSSSTFVAGAVHHFSLQHLLPPPFSSAGTGKSVTIALPAGHEKRIDSVTIAATPISYAFMEEKKPAVVDESRRLFQRLWTDDDEIELLRSFLEYTSSRGVINSAHHHDTASFYVQVKSKFQLDFNKNQLVDKIRRLKKKYRTIASKISSGKEHVFKSPHEQASFEISRKIWGDGGGGFRGGGGSTATAVRGGEEAGLGDEDARTPDQNLALVDQSTNLNLTPSLNGFDINHSVTKTPTPHSRKRSRAGLVKLEEKQLAYNNTMPVQKLQLNPQVHNSQILAGMNVVPVTMVAPTAATIPRCQTENVSGSFGLENPTTAATIARCQNENVSGLFSIENPLPVATETGTESLPISIGVENLPQNETTPTGSIDVEKNHPPVGSCKNVVVEERAKNCLSPILKELLSNGGGFRGGVNGLGYAFSPMPLGTNGQMGGFRGGSNGFGYAFSPMPLGLNGEVVTDVKWRKQQILELEVYSKRLELAQDQIKSLLDELRSLDS